MKFVIVCVMTLFGASAMADRFPISEDLAYLKDRIRTYSTEYSGPEMPQAYSDYLKVLILKEEHESLFAAADPESKRAFVANLRAKDDVRELASVARAPVIQQLRLLMAEDQPSAVEAGRLMNAIELAEMQGVSNHYRGILSAIDHSQAFSEASEMLAERLKKSSMSTTDYSALAGEFPNYALTLAQRICDREKPSHPQKGGFRIGH